MWNGTLAGNVFNLVSKMYLCLVRSVKMRPSYVCIGPLCGIQWVCKFTFKGKVHFYWYLSKTSVLTWCISTYAQHNKRVKFWAQLVIGVGRKWWKKKHPCWTNCVLSDRNKRLCIAKKVFYYFSEKLPLFQNLCYFRGSRFSQCFIVLSTALQCSLPSQFLS